MLVGNHASQHFVLGLKRRQNETNKVIKHYIMYIFWNIYSTVYSVTIPGKYFPVSRIFIFL